MLKMNELEGKFLNKLIVVVFGNLFTAIGYSIKFIWDGIFKSSKIYKQLILVYIVLVIGLFPYVTRYISIILLIVIAFIFGAIEYRKGYPLRTKNKYFDELFNEIKLYSDNKEIPSYYDEKTLSEYARVFSFKTNIPINLWKSKKDLIEIHTNFKIIDIYQSNQEFDVMNVVFEVQPLPEMLEWDDNYIENNRNVLNIGFSHYGIVGMDLEKNPHAFVAGETGSGKSNIIKCMINQAILKEYEVTLIDFKRGVSFYNFSDYINIHYDYDTALNVFKELVQETNRRLDMFRDNRVDNIKDYNKIAVSQLSRKIIFIDELAELLKTRDKDISNMLYDSIETLTRLSRAAGIHLIMGIQRPDSTIINGQIKNNVPYRVCGRFVDKEPSRIMLNTDLASTLTNIKGRFIVKDDSIQEIQSFYFKNDVQYSYSPNKQESKNKTEPEESQKKQTEKKEMDFDFSDIN